MEVNFPNLAQRSKMSNLITVFNIWQEVYLTSPMKILMESDYNPPPPVDLERASDKV